MKFLQAGVIMLVIVEGDEKVAKASISEVNLLKRGHLEAIVVWEKEAEEERESGLLLCEERTREMTDLMRFKMDFNQFKFRHRSLSFRSSAFIQRVYQSIWFYWDP